jgi:hypothetical protein
MYIRGFLCLECPHPMQLHHHCYDPGPPPAAVPMRGRGGHMHSTHIRDRCENRYAYKVARSERVPIGAITTGSFSLTRGHGFAIGCVSAAATARLPAGCLRYGVPLGDTGRYRTGVEATVLVRDVNSLQYRFATMVVCTGGAFYD